MHIAAIHGKVQVVKTLVDLKADISQATADGKDAADLAHLNEETEIEEYLRSKVASSHRTEGNEVKQDVTYVYIGCLPFTRAHRSVYRLGQFGQMVSKFPFWEIPFGTDAYHFQKSLPFTKKFARRRRLTRGSKNKSFD